MTPGYIYEHGMKDYNEGIPLSRNLNWTPFVGPRVVGVKV